MTTCIGRAKMSLNEMSLRQRLGNMSTMDRLRVERQWMFNDFSRLTNYSQQKGWGLPFRWRRLRRKRSQAAHLIA